ncbi:hypothetical protein ACX818_001343 [Acinetobacter baumannii]
MKALQNFKFSPGTWSVKSTRLVEKGFFFKKVVVETYEIAKLEIKKDHNIFSTKLIIDGNTIGKISHSSNEVFHTKEKVGNVYIRVSVGKDPIYQKFEDILFKASHMVQIQ